MGRKKIRPEIDESKMGLNPFVGGYEIKLEIPVRKLERKVTNKFDNPDVQEFYLEVAPYTKLYEVAGGKEKMAKLPLRSKEMLLYILHYLESGQEYIWINRSEYMKMNGIKSVNTFKTAVEELSLRSYVCPHVKIKDLLWINPGLFFRGNRVDKYPNNLKIVKSKKEEKE